MKTGFEIKGLAVKYPAQQTFALKDINLQIPLGSFTVVLGANGSGKSTLLKCLAGIQQWSAGSVIFDGRSRGSDYPDFNAKQILISEDILLPDFKIKQLLKTYQQIWHNFDLKVFERVISFSSISLEHRPKELSRGQRILLQFALGLGTRVPILLIDEVTAALDPFVRRKVVEELCAHTKESGTVILATNIASETQHINSNLVLINAGEVFKTGEHHILRKEFRKKYFENEYVDAMDAAWIEVARDDHGIFAVSEASADNLDTSGVVTLEEIFTYFVEKAKR